MCCFYYSYTLKKGVAPFGDANTMAVRNAAPSQQSDNLLTPRWPLVYLRWGSLTPAVFRASSDQAKIEMKYTNILGLEY